MSTLASQPATSLQRKDWDQTKTWCEWQETFLNVHIHFLIFVCCPYLPFCFVFREPIGTMGSRAFSHDSIFLDDQVLTDDEPTRVLSQENVPGKIKALQVTAFVFFAFTSEFRSAVLHLNHRSVFCYSR